jgi:hypothetical protein
MYNGQHGRETITRCYRLERGPPAAGLGVDQTAIAAAAGGDARGHQPVAETGETRWRSALYRRKAAGATPRPTCMFG